MPGNTVEKAFIAACQAMQPDCVQNLHPPQICAEALIRHGKGKHATWRHRPPDFIQHQLHIGNMLEDTVTDGIRKARFGQWQGGAVRLHKQRVNLAVGGFLQRLPPRVGAEALLTRKVSLCKMPIARTDI